LPRRSAVAFTSTPSPVLNLYRVLRYPLFQLDAETAHELVASSLRTSLALAPARTALRAVTATSDPALTTRLWDLEFPNPLGLAAGLDKDGTLFNALGAFGFGFVEIGTVTGEAQPGNPRPRLFRLPADEALLNRMGFNNPGAERVSRRLSRTSVEPVLGINIGKSKNTPLEAAIGDYLRSVDLLQRYASYMVVNVSSPNTPGLRTLQDARPLRELLDAVVSRCGTNAVALGRRCPVLVKLAPDLADSQVEEAVQIALDSGVAGVVATNTTVSRAGLSTPAREVDSLGAGGISGRPLRDRACEVVARIHRQTGGGVPVIGVGGIMDAGDAWERIRAGASLLQIYTAFVYRGPGVIREITEGLSRRLRQAGMSSIAQAVGTAAR
jgi:dihydroorotate dehydrogenase